MRILVTADWHLDLWGRAGVDPIAGLAPVMETLDVLIIAGDLSNNPLRNWPGVLDRIARLIDPKKVVIVPGNHDYYFWDLNGDDHLRALVEAAGMTFGQKLGLELGCVRFLSCTLWSDFALCGDAPAAMSAAARSMNDYNLIRCGQSRARPADTLAVHQDHLAWLTKTVREPFEGRTIVVTHHCPSPSATGAIDFLTPAFTSNLDAWILEHNPDLWLFGHTHRHLEGLVGQTPIVNISLGYQGEVPRGRELDILLRGLVDTKLPGLLVQTSGDQA